MTWEMCCAVVVLTSENITEKTELSNGWCATVGTVAKSKTSAGEGESAPEDIGE